MYESGQGPDIMFCDASLHCSESSSLIHVRPPVKFVLTQKLSSSSYSDVLDSHFATSKGWAIAINIILTRFNSVHHPVLFRKKAIFLRKDQFLLSVENAGGSLLS
jgi:hypothetical protein